MMTLTDSTFRGFGKHGMTSDTTHDDVARLDFAMNLFRHMGNEIVPGHRKLYDNKVAPQFVKSHGRKPKDRHEVRKAMLDEDYFRMWSMLRIYAQENTYDERRKIVERNLDDLIARAKPRREDKGSVEIDPEFEVPRYQKPFDMHWMPGSFFTDFTDNDVAAGAMYDLGGLYITTNGMLGKYNNGAGYAVATWIKQNYPHLKPKRILDQGCTVGANTLPYKDAWPDAEVIGIDIGGPCLRYAHRRAESLGYGVTFSQQNAEHTKYEDESFDMVLSTMFLHETSNKAVYNIVKENHRLLKPGGLMLHVEQPPFDMIDDPFDQLMKDWDTHNNNEPFWGRMHDMDLEDVAIRAGFKKENIVQTMAAGIRPTDENTYNPSPAKWFIYAATK
jgi:ubiquinone/menaquinone biosynthesis C-methylase UbiE